MSVEREYSVSLVQDDTVKRAASNILQRSERQQNIDKLIDTYVDVGIVPQLNNNNNQIIYGRRGTGKTHIFKVLLKQFGAESENVSIYVDCRVLGSTAQFSDHTYPMKVRCLALFRDFMGVIYDELLVIISDTEGEVAEKAFALLHDLSNALLEDKKRKVVEEVVETSRSKSDLFLGVGLSVVPESAKVNLSASESRAGEVTEKARVYSEDKIIFGEIHKLLKEILGLIQCRLILLIDEWSSLPLDIQPYFSEFIKKSFFANELIVVKIASLEYRPEFNITTPHGIVGFEPGADISIALDIDDYYVYDRNPDGISRLFLDIVYKHIKSELPKDYLEGRHGIVDGEEFGYRLFTTDKVYNELARASEGVVRDLINIFTHSFFDSVRRGRDTIDQKSVLEAARGWFEKDKNESLDQSLRDILSKIISEVIGNKKARSFLLPKELQKHQYIQKLFDLRILHLVQRGYADKDSPGKRYNIYTLDYGTYVDLLKTTVQPKDYMTEGVEDGGDYIVPFDDKRSIRRIVLTSDFLDG